MRGIDSVMRQIVDGEPYLTASYAKLNRRTKQLSVVSAGHPPLIRVAASGVAETIDMNGEPLGVFNSVVLHRQDLRVSRGDRLYLYSDGLIERSPGAGRRAGLDRLVDGCVRRRSAPLSSAVREIVDEVRAGRPRCDDDLLLLAVEALP